MRDSGRENEILKTFEDKWCQICSEAPPHYLRWWPHHEKIRRNIMRHGKKTIQRHSATELIEESIVVCWNCIQDRKWDSLKAPWPA